MVRFLGWILARFHLIEWESGFYIRMYKTKRKSYMERTETVVGINGFMVLDVLNSKGSNSSANRQ